ncbi:NAD(P)-dependent oxidoreductase [Catellatospora bangladeshensis]|uniref:Oxidoreductase n=1 Tax=Catellatospora bangladeshensis TaxID=310355 RepID=A0A8J3JYU7_9ACTN|nr:NAD(P)-dependent oxidoreductase [Catellatospora bangladeshensis]GIF86209.1 oxidoreductase [Catellatospora bangladeshensis]
MTRVAVCGLGRMGTAMAQTLLAAGYPVTVWNRTPAAAADLAGQGAVPAPSAAEAAAGAETVVLMLFDGAACAQVLSGPDGVLAGAAPGTLAINLSTIGPEESTALGAQARAAGLRYVEAPVLGSVPAVRAGSLNILAGGTAEDVAAATPVLSVWGKPRHTGDVGTATALKLVANLALGVVAAGMRDAVRLGEDFGLPRELVLDTLAVGAFERIAGRSRERLGADDYDGAPFTLGALAKDLDLALSRARRPLPVAAAARDTARDGVTHGDADSDIAALARTTVR